MRKSLYRRHNQVFLELLRRYREQGKFRQRDLAQHLGSGQGTVSKAETGNRRLDVIELREWLMAMGADFLEFMTELHEQLEASSHQFDPWFPSGPGDTSASPDDELAGPLAGEADRMRVDAAQLRFERQVAALASALAPAMRLALEREVADTLADAERDQHQGRVVTRWMSRLPAGKKEATSLLQPSDAEIAAHAQDMAQLMLSNWMGLLSRRTVAEVRKLLEAARSPSPDIPGEVLAGCLAWPIPEVEAKGLLVAYLRESWPPDLLNDWPLVLLRSAPLNADADSR